MPYENVKDTFFYVLSLDTCISQTHCSISDYPPNKPNQNQNINFFMLNNHLGGRGKQVTVSVYTSLFFSALSQREFAGLSDIKW